MKIEQKKSAVDLNDLAIGIIVLGIVVSVGATVLITARNTQVTNLPSYSVVNESLTTVTGAGETLSSQWVKSINQVINNTGTVINSGNWSLSVNEGTGVGTLTSTTSGMFNNSNWNVSYSVYNVSDPRWKVPDLAATGLTEYGNWFKILVIVGIAAVVLAIIFSAFGKGKENQPGVGY